MVDVTLTSKDLPFDTPPAPVPVLGLVVLWALDEPHRVGEFLPARAGRPVVVGRGDAMPGDPAPRTLPLRLRPGSVEARPPLVTPRISRVQLLLEPDGDALRVTCLGRTTLRHVGQRVDEVSLVPGDVIEVHNALLLMCARRIIDEPAPSAPYAPFPFGEADPFGLVGESAAIWAVRSALAFAARRSAHVLVHGPSGAGKELLASALHGLSPRREGPLVSRNAATFPESLIDAELFGNRKDYPNPGMPDRNGLIGTAHGGMLLLDEIGELPEPLQAHLLRVLDHGEYQRLGEARARRSDLVVVGLTNRPPTALKHDLLARFRHRVEAPGLDQRREDVPLLARALLRRARDEDPELLAPYFDGDHPRMTPRLVEALVRHRYETQVRELDALLWRAIEHARGTWLDLPDSAPIRVEAAPPRVEAAELGADEVRAALEAEDWVVSRAWRRLGLANRDTLRRLIAKHGIERP